MEKAKKVEYLIKRLTRLKRLMDKGKEYDNDEPIVDNELELLIKCKDEINNIMQELENLSD